MKNEFIFQVIDKKTGKILSDLTSKHKKYWVNEKSCRQAVLNRSYYHIKKYPEVEIVKARLITVVENDSNFSNIITKDVEGFANWLASLNISDAPWYKCKQYLPHNKDESMQIDCACKFEDTVCSFDVSSSKYSEIDLIKAWLNDKQNNYFKKEHNNC